MRSDSGSPRRFPRVPHDRRVAAFAIDFGAASLLGSFGGANAVIPLFIIAWYGLRVILVVKNHGQSLGSWALDIKVLDPRLRSVPGLLTLTQREAITGLGSLLIFLGLVNLSPANGFVLVAPLPLLVDYGFALTDNEFRQAWHDRITGTVVVQTRRGYSLDIKVKKIFAQVGNRVK